MKMKISAQKMTDVIKSPRLEETRLDKFFSGYFNNVPRDDHLRILASSTATSTGSV